MGYPFRHGTTVYVQRAARVVDPYSGEVERLDWTDATETAYERCAITPRTNEEPLLAGRAPVYVGEAVHGPFDMDVTPEDRIRIGDQVYEVEGEVVRWQSPFTGRAGLATVNIKRMEG